MATATAHGGHHGVDIPPQPKAIHSFDDAFWELYYKARARGIHGRIHPMLRNYVSGVIANLKANYHKTSIELFKWKIYRTLSNKLLKAKLGKNDKPRDLRKYYRAASIDLDAFLAAHIDSMPLVELVEFISCNGDPDYPRPQNWGSSAPAPLRPRPELAVIHTKKGVVVTASFVSRPGYDLEFKARWVPVEGYDAANPLGHRGHGFPLMMPSEAYDMGLPSSMPCYTISKEEKASPDGTVTLVRVPDWTLACAQPVLSQRHAAAALATDVPIKKEPYDSEADYDDDGVYDEEDEEETIDEEDGVYDPEDGYIFIHNFHYEPRARGDFATSVPSILDLPIEEDLSTPVEEPPFNFDTPIDDWVTWVPLMPERV